MSRFLTSKIALTCVASLCLMNCGGRTSDDDYDTAGSTASGGWTTAAGGRAAFGGTSMSKGGYAVASGGYYYATGGYYYASGGYRATGGYPYATGGYRATGGSTYTSGGKTTGGVVIYAGTKATAGISGYTLTAGRPPIAGTAGVYRGGAGGVAGNPTAVGGGTAGRSNTGGAPLTAGAAGCPAIGCATSCPLGYWASIDGCSSCACAIPASQMSVDTLSCPPTSLTVSVVAQQQSGTWVFNFSWLCSATVTTLGQPASASVGVTILNNTTDPITSANRTYSYSAAVLSFSVSNPQLILYGSGVPFITLPLSVSTGAYLSIRREGNNFVGGLYLPSTQTSGTTSVMLAGAFSVGVP